MKTGGRDDSSDVVLSGANHLAASNWKRIVRTVKDQLLPGGSLATWIENLSVIPVISL
jgi:hypothetical protein